MTIFRRLHRESCDCLERSHASAQMDFALGRETLQGSGAKHGIQPDLAPESVQPKRDPVTGSSVEAARQAGQASREAQRLA